MFLPRPAGVSPALCLRSGRGREARVGRSPREAQHGAFAIDPPSPLDESNPRQHRVSRVHENVKHE